MWQALNRKRRTEAANEAIRYAIEEHNRFEEEHRARLTQALNGKQPVDEEHRKVDLGEGRTLVRRHGAYDPDQKAERVEWLVLEAYRAVKKAPPKNLRQLIKKALS
jgi:hypothetical protein